MFLTWPYPARPGPSCCISTPLLGAPAAPAQGSPARSAGTFPASAASSAALCPQPTGTAGTLSAPQDVPMPCDTSCFPHPLPLVLPTGWEGAAKGAGVGLGGLSRCPGADSLDVQHPTASSDLFRGSIVLYPARGGDSLTWGAWLGHWCLVPGRGAAPDMGSAAPPLPSHHAWPQDASPAANCSSVQGSCSLMDRGGKVQLHPRPSHHRRPPLAGPPPPRGGVRCAQGWP